MFHHIASSSQLHSASPTLVAMSTSSMLGRCCHWRSGGVLTASYHRRSGSVLTASYHRALSSDRSPLPPSSRTPPAQSKPPSSLNLWGPDWLLMGDQSLGRVFVFFFIKEIYGGLLMYNNERQINDTTFIKKINDTRGKIVNKTSVLDNEIIGTEQSIRWQQWAVVANVAQRNASETNSAYKYASPRHHQALADHWIICLKHTCSKDKAIN
jgi:hypothetical protein